MTVEPLIVAGLAACGAAASILAGLSRVRDHLAFALPVGCAMVTSVSVMLLVSPLAYSAARAVVLTGSLAALLLVLGLRSVGGDERIRRLLPAALVVAAAMPTVLAIRRLRMTRVTADSFEYLQSGGTLEAVGQVYDDAFLLVNRQVMLPLLHNLAVLGDEFFLISLAPLFLFSLLATLWWLVGRGRAMSRVGWHEHAVVAALILLLVTTNRMAFHAFYINTHLFVGVHLLHLMVLAWLAPHGRAGRGGAAIAALVLVPIVVARPEGALLVVLALLALLVGRVDPGRLRLPTWGLLASVVIWWLFGLGALAGWSPFSPAVAAIAVSAGLVALVALWERSPFDVHVQRWTKGAVHAVLWLALGAMVALEGPDTLLTSVEATWTNLRGEGLWGALPVALLAAVVACLFLAEAKGVRMFLLPAAWFVPLMLFLAYAREGAYRVGPGDSLNRAWVHVIPLLVGFVCLAVSQRDRGGDDDVRVASSSHGVGLGSASRGT